MVAHKERFDCTTPPGWDASLSQFNPSNLVGFTDLMSLRISTESLLFEKRDN